MLLTFSFFEKEKKDTLDFWCKSRQFLCRRNGKRTWWNITAKKAIYETL